MPPPASRALSARRIRLHANAVHVTSRGVRLLGRRARRSRCGSGAEGLQQRGTCCGCALLLHAAPRRRSASEDAIIRRLCARQQGVLDCCCPPPSCALHTFRPAPPPSNQVAAGATMAHQDCRCGGSAQAAACSPSPLLWRLAIALGLTLPSPPAVQVLRAKVPRGGRCGYGAGDCGLVRGQEGGRGSEEGIATASGEQGARAAAAGSGGRRRRRHWRPPLLFAKVPALTSDGHPDARSNLSQVGSAQRPQRRLMLPVVPARAIAAYARRPTALAASLPFHYFTDH